MTNVKRQNQSNAPLAISAKARRTAEPPISDLIARAVANPALISFAAGLVDESSLPVTAVNRVASRLLADPRRAQAALQYGTTNGLLPLRQQLLTHIETLEQRSARSMGFTANDILMTTGSQQSLFLIGEALLDVGDIVIAESPSYFVYTGALASMGATVIGIPMDRHGMQVERIPAVLDRLKHEGKLPRLKFIYCTSFFQNPTGISLSIARRKRLLEIARACPAKHRLLIVEDAAYRELQYEGRPLPSIKSFDRYNLHTILTQTFSKPFAPGLKLGYTVLPPDLMEHVARQKGNHDFGSANLCQWLAQDIIAGKLYAPHVRRLRSIYRAKRDRMLRALEKHVDKRLAKWLEPAGGLYVWLTLPTRLQTGPDSELFAQCLKRGVLYVPGEYAYGEQADTLTPTNHLRLCFGKVPMGRIDRGIARLAEALACVSSGTAGQIGRDIS